jgi:phenylalanyl-tRNA synthetase alpha chain
MSDDHLVEQLSSLEKRVLTALNEIGRASPEQIQESSGLSQTVEVMNASSWLEAKGLVRIEEKVRRICTLKRPEMAERPLPEKKLARVVLEDFDGSAPLSALKKGGRLKTEEIQIALGWIRKKGWGDISKDDGETIITLTGKGRSELEGKGQDELVIERLAEGALSEDDSNRDIISQLRQRRDFLNERLITERSISLTDEGKRIAASGFELKEEIGQVTPELIQSGAWRDVSIRKYDVKAFAPTVHGGRKHPLTLLINRIRSVFLTMGFTEIVGDYVESAFWNMDVLFTAQDHPARELHDTFYTTDPESFDLEKDRDLVEVVRQVHENGWKTGSLGWRYPWSETEAGRALLRTHTTVNTIRQIAKDPEPPFKVFSIGRVFRNEAMDSTHLPEFMQIEGIVCEKGASFDMLCGLLKEFYARMGIPKIRIRPAYFPYTEPSLEVEIFYNDQWMELGGAGIFRAEVTEPLGVKDPVLAWGFGLERLAMLLWDLRDIRDIYVSDMDWLKRMPQV